MRGEWTEKLVVGREYKFPSTQPTEKGTGTAPAGKGYEIHPFCCRVCVLGSPGEERLPAQLNHHQ